MKEQTKVVTERGQHFSFSIENDWLVVRSHEELERLYIEEKKAKKAKFFQNYGTARKIEKQIPSQDSERVLQEIETQSLTGEEYMVPGQEIYVELNSPPDIKEQEDNF